jgi:hypothetical protein
MVGFPSTPEAVKLQQNRGYAAFPLPFTAACDTLNLLDEEIRKGLEYRCSFLIRGVAIVIRNRLIT